MANFNKVILAGNLTRDPEVRYTPKGTAIAKLGLAINRTWKNEAGETKEEVTFVDVDAFGRTAEVISQYLKKGRPILVEGRLKLDQWDDKQTGQKRSRLEVLKQRRAEREAHELNTMTELSKSLAKLICVVTVKTGEDGKMFGTVTPGMIADQLKTQFEVTLDKRKIHFEHPIRTLGEHDVELRLHADVATKLKVRVECSTPIAV